jgi:hypothetical protein
LLLVLGELLAGPAFVAAQAANLHLLTVELLPLAVVLAGETPISKVALVE